MSNYDGWTAGRHWREAMGLTELTAGNRGHVHASVLSAQALVHLAAAQLLLDHPPVDVPETYPVGAAEPPRDWRNG